MSVIYETEKDRRRRQLKNLRIDDVSSVDRGAGVGCRVVMHKRDDLGEHPLSDSAILKRRREYEAAHPGFPKWEGDRYKQEKQQMTPNDQIQEITKRVNAGEIGKQVADALATDVFNKSIFDINRTTPDGRPMTAEMQIVDHYNRSPVFKALRRACVSGLDSTQKELDALYSGQKIGETTYSGHPVAKAEPPQTMSSVINAQLDKMANELLARAKKEGVPGLTFAKCYEAIITKTHWGRQLYSLERLHRTGVA
jgi:hypothetical protein